MNALTPATAEELAGLLRDSSEAGRWVNLEGNGSKRSMGGAIAAAPATVSTSGLNRVLQYEPRDLTVSVEAGLPWRELTRVLAENRQMIPLDPPWAETATVGGVIAANSSGPRRRLYGTARDFVIGMKFATLEGKLVQSGGMVVKNVAGLDMAKLMIGSLGTLAAVTVINFKVMPAPEIERSFVLSFLSLEDALAARDKIIKGILQPPAIDLLNPPGAAALGRPGWALCVRAEGNRLAVDRYERELADLGQCAALEGAEHRAFWKRVEEFAAEFLKANAEGAIARASGTLQESGAVMHSLEVPALLRAGSGVCYACFGSPGAAAGWAAAAALRGWKAVVECAPVARKTDLEMWPAAGGDLKLMERVKALFDPKYVLNRGRLYNRI